MLRSSYFPDPVHPILKITDVTGAVQEIPEVLHLNPGIPLGIPIFNAGVNLVSQMKCLSVRKRFDPTNPEKGVIYDVQRDSSRFEGKIDPRIIF